jgi:hypothetical protein
MTQQHPITPSDELIGEWMDTDEGGPSVISRIVTRAAQWGADQELEACRMEIIDGAGLFYIDETSDRVRLAEDIWTARRPKPPSLKEQALALVEQHEDGWRPSPKDWDTIRRALEALPDSIVVFPSQC